MSYKKKRPLHWKYHNTMKRILLFAILLFSISSSAQINLGMGPMPVTGYMDTVLEGSIDSYVVKVTNYGPGTLSDTIHLYTSVFDSSGTFCNIVAGYDSNTLDSIPPGDSLSYMLTAVYNVSPTGYHYGIDVIVVWPVAYSANTVDSLYFNVYIIDPSGVNDLDPKELLKLYPNPVSDRLTIENNTPLRIEAVRIYDLSGKLVMETNEQTCINMNGLSPGMYTIDVQLSNKTHKAVKIMVRKTSAE